MKRNRVLQGCGRWRDGLSAVSASVLLATSIHGQVLPLPAKVPESQKTLSGPVRLFVRSYQFVGNKAFSAAELEKVTASFANREVTSEDIEQARRAVTLFYVNHGYLNSGAIIPDQNPKDGVIVIQIVEGVLSGITLHDNHWLRDDYIKRRLARWSEAPLNLARVQEGLQLLRQNPNVRQVNAELKPGGVPGESLLDLRVVDQQPFRLGMQFDNQRPPSVGAEQISVIASDLNLTGHSDPLEFRYGIANATRGGMEFSGTGNLEGSYLVPLTAYDTTLGLHGSRLNTTIIEEPFNDLDIRSLTTSYRAQLRQPFFQSAHQEAALGLGFDRRENKTWLLDSPFTFSPGAINGTMAVSALRISQEWTHRGQSRVVALRSTFNVGIDAFDATNDRIDGHPNSRFYSWVGQGQYVQRLGQTQNEMILRVTGQWTPSSLLALEQLSVGGMGTVRGYLENQLVRDRGIVSSVEFRLPVAYNKAGAGILHFAPFFDYGSAWNVLSSAGPSTIYSAGPGLVFAPNKHISAQLYWGYRLRHLEMPHDAGAQGLGLSFRINVQAF